MTYYLSGYGSQYGVYVYVPYEINEDTSYMIYYCGGTGQEIESILWAPGVVHYFASSRDPEKYSPNAICIFYGTSGYDNIPTRVIDTLKLLHDVSEETGAPVKDVITVGSSNGCYTALHLAAALYTEGGIPVRCSLSLDAGLEWMHDYDWLTPEECDALVESGCTLYLFEQEGVGLEKEGIRLMVEKGVKTVVVECRIGDHNMISENAYNYGIFSWGVHEFDILNPLEYIFVPLTQEKLQEYYDSTG